MCLDVQNSNNIDMERENHVRFYDMQKTIEGEIKKQHFRLRNGRFHLDMVFLCRPKPQMTCGILSFFKKRENSTFQFDRALTIEFLLINTISRA